MSRTVILKEITTTTDWLFEGIPLAASGTVTITDESIIDELANNNDLRDAITAGDITVNDGSSDLSAVLGLNYLEKDHNNVSTSGAKKTEVSPTVLTGVSHTLPGALTFTPGADTLDVLMDGQMLFLGATEDYTEDAGGTSIKFTFDLPAGVNMTYVSRG